MMIRKHFKLICWIFVCVLVFAGCSGSHSAEEEIPVETIKIEPQENSPEVPGIEPEIIPTEPPEPVEPEIIPAEPETIDADWSEYFNGLNGAAVIFDPANNRYTIYNNEAAQTRRSPCSTFKIISSLIALENGILDPENSVRTWSGEVFWNADWNRDIDFSEAFRSSCVWYYRQLIDDIGKDLMQQELDKLQYGNCDISDWEGRLNTNNNNRALTGFWIESSLLISTKEQTEVIERIFDNDSEYSEETQNELKSVMLVQDRETDIPIYGKTGMGKAEGIVVDAWFTGFAETEEGNIYFCVHLDRTDGMDVSSPLAKDIAIQIVSDYRS